LEAHIYSVKKLILISTGLFSFWTLPSIASDQKVKSSVCTIEKDDVVFRKEILVAPYSHTVSERIPLSPGLKWHISLTIEVDSLIISDFGPDEKLRSYSLIRGTSNTILMFLGPTKIRIHCESELI
jgi:hypothetical protein